MSTAKVVCLSPSSVAQDWVDRSVKMQTRSTSLSFPSEVRDLTSSSLMNIRESISSVSVDKTFSLGSQRDNRSSPVTTSTQLSGGSDGTVHKCRQLPCRTFVSTGSCPYGDRCVFLHDISIMSKPVFIKIRRKSKDDTVTDAFFWPTLPSSQVNGKLNSKHQPDISQSYSVPPPGTFNEFNSINDAAVHSMWEHFVDFLAVDPLSVVTKPRKVPSLNCFQSLNPYSKKQRLPVFMQLSQGKQLSSSGPFLY